MAVRTLWKAVLRVGSQEVPVRLYSAASDHTIRFRLLHREDLQPVKQRMVHGDSGKEVPSEDRRKGAEIDRGTFVLLSEEELDELEPTPSRTIEIRRFVSRSELDHEWYDRPYYLGPDGEEEAYWALVEALSASGLEGLARWVMRKKEYAGALFVHEGTLALVTLRFAEQVVSPEEIGAPDATGLDEREVEMAGKLLSMLERDFDPSRYRDEHRGRVLELIETKAKGGTVKKKKAAGKKKTSSLAEALEASLAETEKQAKKKPAKKAR